MENVGSGGGGGGGKLLGDGHISCLYDIMLKFKIVESPFKCVGNVHYILT